MKSTIKTLLISFLCLTSNFVFAQKQQLKVEIENISVRTPEDWKVEKTEKKKYGFTIKLFNEKNQNALKIACIKRTMNLEAAIVNQSSETSKREGFQDMIIERVKDGKFGKYSGKFLEYTNSPLRDYYRGGYYSVVDNGYTYIIEYYSADLPEDRLLIKNILSSLDILKPESRPNFFIVEKEFIPENVSAPKPEETKEAIDAKNEEDSKGESKLTKEEEKELEKQSKKAKKEHLKVVKEEKKADSQIAVVKDKTKAEIKAEKKALKKAEKERIKAEKKSAKEKDKAEKKIEKIDVKKEEKAVEKKIEKIDVKKEEKAETKRSFFSFLKFKK